MKLGLFAFAMVTLLGCGDDDSSGSDSDFERACKDFCGTASNAGCPIANCDAGCSYIDDQFGACTNAYAALFSCAAKGPVECVNGYPEPTSQDCVDESAALSKCVIEKPCLDFCATAQAAGCGGTACVDRCKADEQASTFCSIERDDLMECQTMSGIACKGDAPAPPEACSTQAHEFATCVASNDPCAGECLSADLAGCVGESRQACVDACTKVLDGTVCTGEYQQLLSCHGQYGVACSGQKIASTPECMSQQNTYDTCASPPF